MLIIGDVFDVKVKLIVELCMKISDVCWKMVMCYMLINVKLMLVMVELV